MRLAELQNLSIDSLRFPTDGFPREVRRRGGKFADQKLMLQNFLYIEAIFDRETVPKAGHGLSAV